MIRVLVVRLGALGDVLHALPAVADLKRAFPDGSLTWAIDPKWTPLLVGNRNVDDVILFNRRSWTNIRATWARLGRERFDIVIDMQGLIKSALFAAAARGGARFGFAREELREKAASLFYERQVATRGPHVVDRNRELARAAGAAAGPAEFFIPAGHCDSELPGEPFVLANPLAGWPGKQWPLGNYAPLAGRLRSELGLALVVNGAPAQREQLTGITGAQIYCGGLDGLIDATRRATAVLGLDSGPMHLAAALGKPGVALFGPTDPARNGPYGGSFTVLRVPGARTTYKRDQDAGPGLGAMGVAEVMEALRGRLGR